mgnify:CR=1 FL=1
MAKAKSTGSTAVIDALTDAYNMEVETVMNYIANSVDLDGALAAPIKAALAADIPAELSHAQMVAKRIKTIGGRVPGSLSLHWGQKSLQPPAKTTDLLAVIQGVIDAEEAAIAGYERIIQLCDGVDFATQDMAIALLSDEQEHRREFLGFQKELEGLLKR